MKTETKQQTGEKSRTYVSYRGDVVDYSEEVLYDCKKTAKEIKEIL